MDGQELLQRAISIGLITILLVGCGSTSTSIPPTVTFTDLNPEWLVTEGEINEFTDEIGIIDWKLDEETVVDFKVCRSFNGMSWSANPNGAMNCIHKIPPGSTFEEVIALLYDAEILFPTDIELEPVLKYDHDFALYAYTAPNGHSFFTAFLVSNGLLFRAGVGLGTPIGNTSETIFDSEGEIIETFLKNILMINLDRIN